MTTIKNSGGNRALVAYCYAWRLNEDFDEALYPYWDNAIKSVFESQGIEYSGENQLTRIGLEKTANITLSSNAWARSLKIGNCSGDLLVGVYFYNAPQPVDTRGTMAEINEFFGEEIEPEPPSITSLVCGALQEAFPDGKVGASSFVISPELVDFELKVQ